MKINYYFNEIKLINLNLHLKILTTISFESFYKKKGNYITFSYHNKSHEFIVVKLLTYFDILKKF